VAWIELDRDEVERRDLPFTCVKCGRPADAWKSKWLNPNPGRLPPNLLQAELPVCRSHRNHWLWRTVFAWAGGVLVLLFLAGIAVLIEGQGPPGWVNVLGPVWLLSFVGLILWVPVMIVLYCTAVRCTRLTDRVVVLVGVSPGFVESVKEHRRLARKERKAGRRGRKGKDYPEV
jgi:hypothetical protein